MKFFYPLLFFFSAAALLYAQNELPKIEPADFDGIKINRSEFYDGSSLWGYIDGGADLYLEYGFDRLSAQEIQDGGSKYRVDIYKMNSPEAAYGIFSVSSFKCSQQSVSEFSCVTPYQVLAAKGKYFISVVNEKGTADEQKFTKAVVNKILSHISASGFTLPAQLKEVKYIKDVKFINGILGIQNALPDYEAFFTGIDKFSLYTYTENEGDKYTTVCIITPGGRKDSEEISARGEKRIAEMPAGTIFRIKKLSGGKIALYETNLAQPGALYKIME